jgi:hypothetical protein
VRTPWWLAAWAAIAALAAAAPAAAQQTPAGLTIIPEREQIVDFTDPSHFDVAEIVVTGPGSPPTSTRASSTSVS